MLIMMYVCNTGLGGATKSIVGKNRKTAALSSFLTVKEGKFVVTTYNRGSLLGGGGGVEHYPCLLIIRQQVIYVPEHDSTLADHRCRLNRVCHLYQESRPPPHEQSEKTSS